MNFLRKFDGCNTVAAAANLGKVPQHCVHQHFQRHAAHTPDAVAITCGKEMLTYAQLNVRANQVAHWLLEHGVRPEKLVGICVEHSLDAVVALLGILKSGGAYVPLDSAFPRQRLAQILEDSQPEVMITQRTLTTMVAPFAKHTLLLGSPQLALLSRENPDIDVQPHNLAYVIFTSGSTGRAKGVQVEHRGLMNVLQATARTPGFTDEDVMVAETTLCFDVAALEIFLPLIMGARLVSTPPEVARDGSALRELLDASSATMMQGTPTTWRMILESGWRCSKRLKIVCGGEAMPPDLARELIPRCSSLWNAYGPTEATICSTISRVSSVEPRIPIGRPIGNTEVYIVDPQLRPVPVGITGELLIGGDGLARGYLNRAELTAERFIPDPFSKNRSARVYKTGDLCRWRPDGMIDLLGRDDCQVKVRGHRIELGDIEAALESHPKVKQATTKVVEEAGREKRLVGYVVGTGVEAQELRTYLAERLPKYMLPSRYVKLTALPLTPNRKVDRNALPPPNDTNALDRENCISPRTATEQRVSEMVSTLLGLERVGVEDNFFLIGGHSLFGTHLIARIRDNFGVELALRSVFESPTTALLARTIEHLIVSKNDTMSEDEIQLALEQANSGGGQK